MNALVTGAAGFIGSHLSEGLLDAGATVIGVDCFTDYYARPLKEANLAAVMGRPGFTFVEAALQDTDLKALVKDVTHVFHVAGQAGVRKSWGRRLRRLYKRQRRGDPAPARGACRRTDSEVRLFLELVGLRGQCAPSGARGYLFAAPVSLRRVKARRRAPWTPLLGKLWRASCLAPVFHRLWAAAAAGYGVSAFPDRRDGRTTPLRFTATASRLVTSRSCPTSSRQHGGRRARDSRGACTILAGGSRVTLNHALDLIGRVTGKAVTVHREPEKKGDMRHTYADTSLARRDLSFTPRVSLEGGLEQQYRWLINR